MPQIRPNSAIVVAQIIHIESYSRQSDFSVLLLNVKSAKPRANEPFMFDETKDVHIKALVNTGEYMDACIKENSTVTVEVKKVSFDLWRIIKFIAT